MYHIALCDDDLEFPAVFRDTLHEFARQRQMEYELFLYPDVPSLRAALLNGEYFDLIFLDILIGKDNGIEFARDLRAKKLNTEIIFVTVSPEFALDGYDTAPLHYLIKPLDRSRLEQAMDRFLARTSPARIYIKTVSGMLSLIPNTILYLESYGHALLIHYNDGKTEQVLCPLKDMEAQLAPLTFFRSHKSFLINLTCITKIERYRVTLSSGDELPIGKSRYNQLQTSFIEYASRKKMEF